MNFTFILLGFSDFHYNHVTFFTIILTVYVLTWTCNLLLIMSISLSPQLHTPMYFFLGNLSVVDISFSTVTVPRLLSDIVHGASPISFIVCFTQIYFFVALAITEGFILVIMAFDRYVAICRPLHYTTIMNKKVQVILALSCWVAAFLNSLLHAHTVSQLTYCKDRLIHHFFCDLTALIKLSCSSTALAEMLIYGEGPFFVIIPFILILFSYVLIAKSIMRLKSNASRSKAFSSCSSHLMVISLFYITIISIYFRPPSYYSPQYDQITSLSYTLLTPMLNSFIYSLRNQDVKKAMKKIFEQVWS